jgi:group I intron endonuclease
MGDNELSGKVGVRMYILYMYRHRASQKAYIGVTCDPKQRFQKHARGNSSALAFNRAVKRDGIEAFEFTTLAIFDNLDAVNYHENAAITAFGTLAPSGYNLVGGAPKSQYFGPMSDETKQKIGKANQKNTLTPEQQKKMLDARKGKPVWNKGKTFTAEHRAHLSAAHKGVPLSDEHRTNIIASVKRSWENKTAGQMENYSKELKERWANMTPEQRKVHSENCSKGRLARRSNNE